jgi:riboflavin synthase
MESITMFTGLIECTGKVHSMQNKGLGMSVGIKVNTGFVSELTLGESVAVDGACLTVTQWRHDVFWVDASSETIDRCTLGQKKLQDYVHLERALRLGDRLGGHWVSGHIDATGVLIKKEALGEAVCMYFQAPPTVMRYIVAKGSIAIDGASLTVNTLDELGFSIVLIPHSQSILQLSKYTIGTQVNLEADILGKYVEKLLNLNSTDHVSSSTSAIDMSLLSRTGFMK